MGEVAENTTDDSGQVVWYWMDHHPKVYCQLMWENRSQVLVSFTPGSGLVIRTAILMGLKVLVVANTPGHMEVLQASVKQFIRAQIAAGDVSLKPETYDSELEGLKPPGLRHWEQQQNDKKRFQTETPSPSAKKMKALAAVDKFLGTSESSSSKASSVTAKKASAPAPEVPSPAKASALAKASAPGVPEPAVPKVSMPSGEGAQNLATLLGATIKPKAVPTATPSVDLSKWEV